MGKLYILRHGNTFDKGDVVRRVGCRTDLPLSTSGQLQARNVAEGFARQGVTFGQVVCSPLLRTRQTAEALQKAELVTGEMRFADFLREVDYGPDENQPEEAVVARIGEDALKLWDKQGVVPDGWMVDTDVIREGWQTLLNDVAKRDDNVLAVTSNGIARFVLPLVELGDVTPDTLKLGTCCYGVIACEPNAQLISWNEKFI